MKLTTVLRLFVILALLCVAQLRRADAAVLSFSQTEYSVGEGVGNATLTVTVDRSGDPDPGATYTVEYRTLGGSASSGSDYLDVEGTLEFGPGVNAQSIRVPIIDDGTIENAEDFGAILFNPQPQCIRAETDPPCYYQTPTFRNASTRVVIFDNDRANTIQFSPSIYSGNESAPGGGNGQVTLTVTATRFGDPRTVLMVDYVTESDSAVAEQDFKTTSGTITFEAGETDKQIVVELINDIFIESPESFRVRLLNARPTGPGGVQMGTGATSARVDIDDDDGGTSFIQFTTTEYSAGEGDGAAVVTATRSGGAGFKVSAQYTTTAGSATPGEDYQQTSGRVEFESGQYSKAIRINVFQDSAIEPSENFTVTLSNPGVNAGIGSPATANVTILDDEGPPVITSPNTASGQRGEPFSYRITATNSPTSYGASGLPAGLSVDPSTGLISGTPNDFGTFQVQISASNSKGTGTATLTLTIVSGETTVVQFRDDFHTVSPPQDTVTLIVDLARAGGEQQEDVTVDYTTTDGSAKAGEDYQPQAGQLVFAPGQKQQTITVTITHRETPGPDRTFFVDLSNPSRGAVGRSRATIVITHPDFSTKLLNLSTRAPVRTGEGVMIAGFIIQGNTPKRIVLRGIGPSLTQREVPSAIEDTTLTLMDSNGSQIAFNDDHPQNSAEDRQTLEQNGLSPEDERESAIVATLAPGIYTGILRGKSNGNGLIEVYDIGGTAASRFVNIATRSRVNEGDHGAMIGGFIVAAPQDQPGVPQRIVIRALGPSLGDVGIGDVLDNPTLEIYRGSQKILENDDWKSDQRQALQASGLAPTKDKEAAIITDLEPGSYSAVIRGKSNTTGIALAEVYQLNQ